MGDLAAGRITLQFREREGRRASDQAVDREPPVRETASQLALVGLVLGRLAIYGEDIGDFAAVEFAGERMVGHQEPLGSIGQGFANAVDGAVIWRDQTVSIGEVGSDSQAGGTCCSR